MSGFFGSSISSRVVHIITCIHALFFTLLNNIDHGRPHCFVRSSVVAWTLGWFPLFSHTGYLGSVQEWMLL